MAYEDGAVTEQGDLEDIMKYLMEMMAGLNAAMEIVYWFELHQR